MCILIIICSGIKFTRNNTVIPNDIWKIKIIYINYLNNCICYHLTAATRNPSFVELLNNEQYRRICHTGMQYMQDYHGAANDVWWQLCWLKKESKKAEYAVCYWIYHDFEKTMLDKWRMNKYVMDTERVLTINGQWLWLYKNSKIFGVVRMPSPYFYQHNYSRSIIRFDFVQWSNGIEV